MKSIKNTNNRISVYTIHKFKLLFLEPQENKLEHWQNREITADEHVAAIKIQKVFRGFYVRKLKSARIPGKICQSQQFYRTVLVIINEI